MPANKTKAMTPDDVQAYLRASEGVPVTDLIATASEERVKRAQAEHELEKLRRKLSKNPNHLRESLERAVALAGETPAETAMRLLHQKDPKTRRYVLDPETRMSAALKLLPFTVSPFKAKEGEKDSDKPITVVVQNFSGASKKKMEPVVEVKREIAPPKSE